MMLFVIVGATAAIVILLWIVLYVQGKQNAQQRDSSAEPRMVYVMRNTSEHSGPSLYERSQGGQRPFGENSRTRRTEQERTRSDRFFY